MKLEVISLTHGRLELRWIKESS